MTLYHYTCSHVLDRIGLMGVLIPHRQPLLPYSPKLLWLTDQGVPDRTGLGLTSDYISCDRLAVRYRVTGDTADVEPWNEWADWYLKRHVRLRRELELGRQPEAWYISESPVRATRDLAWGGTTT